jgi:hypothetical protein
MYIHEIHTYILYIIYIHAHIHTYLCIICNGIYTFQGFLLFISFNFVSSHIGNQPQEELTKFGYRSERKVEKSKNPAIFWQPADGTY